MAALGSQQADERQRLARAAAEVLADYERVLAENGRLLAENEALRAVRRPPQRLSPPAQRELPLGRAVIERRRNMHVLADGRAIIDFSECKGGKRRRFRKVFASVELAEVALSKVKVDLYQGTFLPPQRSAKPFTDVADEWLESKRSLRPTTFLELQILVGHLKKALAAVSISLDDPAVIERVRDDLLRSLKPQRVNVLLQKAGAIWKFAIRRRYTTANPVALAERLPTRSDEIDDLDGMAREDGRVRREDVYTPAETEQLIEAAEPGLFRAALMTAALTGVRRGELLGLRWPDVRLDDGLLDVRRSTAYAKNQADGTWSAKFFRPKTRHGTRSVPLAPELVSELRKWKLACPPSGEFDLVFPGDDGQPMRGEWLLRKGYEPAVKRARLRHLPFKSLRHGFASILIDRGASPAEVASLMGHATAFITLSTYVHLVPKDSSAVQGLAASIFSDESTGRSRRSR